jgi:pyruvate formate lyase activating enzyme
LRTITLAHASCLVELTNLLITDCNDSDKDIEALVDWIAKLDRSIPLHFSRYFPHYKMNNPPTSPERLDFAYQIAREKLDYVYVGNIIIPDTNNTFCPKCGNLLVERSGFYGATLRGLDGTKCNNCGNSIKIIL